MKSMIKDAGILFVITLFAGLVLGGVYQLTKEPIAQQEERARTLAQPGDVVMMSPASASFDRFRNFEERGRAFKELVNGFC